MVSVAMTVCMRPRTPPAGPLLSIAVNSPRSVTHLRCLLLCARRAGTGTSRRSVGDGDAHEAHDPGTPRHDRGGPGHVAAVDAGAAAVACRSALPDVRVRRGLGAGVWSGWGAAGDQVQRPPLPGV